MRSIDGFRLVMQIVSLRGVGMYHPSWNIHGVVVAIA